MKGILRPCRHHLTREARDRWRAHLCGTCLSLRDTAGQAARALTGYDLLLIPVLIEAQQGQLPTVRAGACALRGMRRADVVDPSSAAARAGAAAMLAAGSGGLCDKLGDGEVPVALRPAAHAAARWFADAARRAAGDAGGDVAPLLEAATRAADVEARPAATLDELLEPAGSAVATAFGQTAAAAGTPTNEAALRRLGDAFGRLVHLLDAVDDRDRDRRQGRFNPLDATGTDHA
ncbi:MAG TPA: DUF5685 family protein, partial [Acidimicrobiales bacterium]|nr:DUF5685 family protein [Acidimicrobiales bacterium]